MIRNPVILVTAAGPTAAADRDSTTRAGMETALDEENEEITSSANVRAFNRRDSVERVCRFETCEHFATQYYC
jgi:hypothetical protein